MKRKCKVCVAEVDDDFLDEEEFLLDGDESRAILEIRENRGKIAHCSKARSEMTHCVRDKDRT